MAADWAAIESAARGVVESRFGSVRTVPADRLKPSGTADRTVVAKQLETKTFDRYELDVRDLGTHSGSPPKNHSRQLTNIEIAVTIWTKLRHGRIKKATRAVRTRHASETAQLVRDAFEWPGNLDTGEASADTGIIRGSVAQTTQTPIREFGDELISEQIITFRGIVNETLPVS